MNRLLLSFWQSASQWNLWETCILWYTWTITNLDKNFLTNKSQCLILNGQSSQLSNVLLEVPKRTILGPLLFLCYINNLQNNVTSRVKLYADDVLLYLPVSNTTDCQNLQKDLERLVQWAVRWQMISPGLNVKWSELQIE